MTELSDPRYLQGIELFNCGDYFESHEVWEDLWQDCAARDRRFYQALIQAAVAIYHFERGNFSGASRLFHSGKRYMEPYAPHYRGLDVRGFWQEMEDYIAAALTNSEPVNPGKRPEINLGSSF